MFWKIFSIVFITLLIAGCGSTATDMPVSKKASSETPEPSKVANIPVAPKATADDHVLSLDDLTTIPPDDVIQEIAYFGGLGGAGHFECYDSLGNEYNKPTVLGGNFLSEVMYEIELNLCGLKIDQDIKITVELPDKTKKEFSYTSSKISGENYGQIDFTYIPNYNDPKGIYKFVFSGEGWSIDRSVEVADPIFAHLYNDLSGQLILYKFQPNENVRIFAYLDEPDESSKQLLGWKQYQVDNKGELIIQKNMNAIFIAVGNVSGEIFPIHEGETIISWTAWYRGKFNVYCSGAPSPVGIKGDKYAEVIPTILPFFDIMTGQQKGTLKKGTIVHIESNATCKASSWWWKVSLTVENNLSNFYFIQEGTKNEQFLRPLEKLPPTPTFDPANIPTCSGTQPTRLQPGANAEVTRSGKAPQLSLRVQPNMTAKQAHVIAAGRKMTILEGPVCAGHSYWWRIRSEQGFEGWAREGDNEDYWIDPLP